MKFSISVGLFITSGSGGELAKLMTFPAVKVILLKVKSIASDIHPHKLTDYSK